MYLDYQSNTLRAVSGLVAARAGTVRFAGRELTNAGPQTVLAAGIAQVPEGRRRFAAMSVRDSLPMGASLRTDSAAVIRRDLEQIYALFPILSDRQRQVAATLSGGALQKCAVGRRLMSAPRLLRIDALSLGLSPTAVDILCDALQALNRDGLTILAVEQEVATAFDPASSAFVMDSGHVTRAGPSAALRDDPAIREAYLGVI